MGNDKKEVVEQSNNKVESKLTVDLFIGSTGGISRLDRAALNRKFGNEERTRKQWTDTLKKATILK